MSKTRRMKLRQSPPTYSMATQVQQTPSGPQIVTARTNGEESWRETFQDIPMQRTAVISGTPDTGLQFFVGNSDIATANRNTGVYISKTSGTTTLTAKSRTQSVTISRPFTHQSDVKVALDFLGYNADNSVSKASRNQLEALCLVSDPEERTRFSTVNHATQTYIRNEQYWLRNVAGGLMTGIAVWNSYENGPKRAGNLITADVIDLSAHFAYYPPHDVYPGTDVRFVDAANVVHTRFLTDIAFEEATDLCVARLNAPLPPEIEPMLMMPPDWADYMYGVRHSYTAENWGQSFANKDVGAGVIWANQFYRTSSGRFERQVINFPAATCQPTVSGPSTAFYENTVEFDSTCPVYILLDNQLIYMGPMWSFRIAYARHGVARTAFLNLIASVGGTIDDLQYANFSGYQTYPV